MAKDKRTAKAIWSEAVGNKLEELGVRGTEIDWDVVSKLFFERNGSLPFDTTVEQASHRIVEYNLTLTKESK